MTAILPELEQLNRSFEKLPSQRVAELTQPVGNIALEGALHGPLDSIDRTDALISEIPDLSTIHNPDERYQAATELTRLRNREKATVNFNRKFHSQ